MCQPDHLRIGRIVGDRIRATRRGLGISQQDLCEMADVHLTSLSRIERGLTMPKVDMIARLATALDVTTAFLVSDILPEDVMPRHRQHITARELLEARRANEAENSPKPVTS